MLLKNKGSQPSFECDSLQFGSELIKKEMQIALIRNEKGTKLEIDRG